MSYEQNDPYYAPAPAAPDAGGGYEQAPHYYQQYAQTLPQQYPTQYATTQYPAQTTTLQSTMRAWFDFRNPGYLKGLAIGAGAALVLANPTVQRAVVTGAVKIWSALQGGLEEVKEQIKDIKAETSQK
jgi:hypothetical protein